MTEVFDMVFQLLVVLAVAIGGLTVILLTHYRLKSRERARRDIMKPKRHITIKEKAAEVKVGKRIATLFAQMLVFIGAPCILIYKWMIEKEANSPNEPFWLSLTAAYIAVIVCGGALTWLSLAYNRAMTQKGMETVTKYSDGNTKWHQYFIVQAIPLTRGVVDTAKIEDETLKAFLTQLDQDASDPTAFVVDGEALYLTLAITTQFDFELIALMSNHPYVQAFKHRDGRTYSYSMPLKTELCRTKLVYMKKTTIVNPLHDPGAYELRSVPIFYCPVDDQDDIEARAKFQKESHKLSAKAVLSAQVAAVEPSATSLLDERETVVENADRAVHEVEEREERLLENIAMEVDLAKKKHKRVPTTQKQDYGLIAVLLLIVAAACLFLGRYLYVPKIPGGGGNSTLALEALRFVFG